MDAQGKKYQQNGYVEINRGGMLKSTEGMLKSTAQRT